MLAGPVVLLLSFAPTPEGDERPVAERGASAVPSRTSYSGSSSSSVPPFKVVEEGKRRHCPWGEAVDDTWTAGNLDECKQQCADKPDCTKIVFWGDNGCGLYKTCEPKKCGKKKKWCQDLNPVVYESAVFTTKSELQAALEDDTSDIENWDVSLIDDFSRLFQGAESFNADLSKWNVAQGTDFEFMFWGASSFDSDLSEWNVVKGMYFGMMFYNAREFNADLSKWNVANGLNYYATFAGASSFNADLSKWNVAKGTYFGGMFLNAGCKTTNCGCTSCA